MNALTLGVILLIAGLVIIYTYNRMLDILNLLGASVWFRLKWQLHYKNSLLLGSVPLALIVFGVALILAKIQYYIY